MKEFSKEEIKELEAIAYRFEEKLREFNADIECENPIQVILKGHLYIEHELIELLEKNIKYPDILESHKLNFSQVSKLVFSMGLLPIELLETMKAINRIRNSCSHNLKFHFGPEEYEELERTFTVEFKDHYLEFLKSHKGKINDLVKLQMALFTMWEYINSFNDIPERIKEKLI